MSTYPLISSVKQHLLTETSNLFAAYATVSLATTVDKEYEFVTPSNKDVYFYGSIVDTNSEAMTIELLEAPVVTDGTTEITLTNFNHTSTREAGTVIYSDPTSVSAGTLVREKIYYKSPQSKSPAHLELNDNPLKLKPSTKYVWRVTNDDNTTKDFHIEWVFMELT